MEISLDCSTTAIGWSIWNEDDLIVYDTFRPDKNLQWRDRSLQSAEYVNNLFKKYSLSQCYIENPPMSAFMSGGSLSLSELFFVQGAMLNVAYQNHSSLNIIEVSTWRKDIGLFKHKGMTTDEFKVESISMANRLFNLNLSYTLTRTGKFNTKESDDNTADSILIYASTRLKYKKKGGF